MAIRHQGLRSHGSRTNKPCTINFESNRGRRRPDALQLRTYIQPEISSTSAARSHWCAPTACPTFCLIDPRASSTCASNLLHRLRMLTRAFEQQNNPGGTDEGPCNSKALSWSYLTANLWAWKQIQRQIQRSSDAPSATLAKCRVRAAFGQQIKRAHADKQATASPGHRADLARLAGARHCVCSCLAVSEDY